MGVGDIPSMIRMREQIRGFELILGINGALRIFGLGSDRLEEVRRQLDDLKAKVDEMADLPNRFNSYFSKDGWLAHGSLDFEVLKNAVDQHESAGSEAGVEVMMQYFSPDNLVARLYFLNWAEELRIRRRLIDLAFEDYLAGRYHAVVPVLLMVIDGAVNDAVGKGFHSDGIELNVWDCITTADGSINSIKGIFQAGRRKTRTETISLPYRNGILHGMDLGYDNQIVAAKCWCFLFVVADWIVAKKSENVRQAKFEEEGRTPSWRELAEMLAANQRAKAANEAWQPRDFDADYYSKLNQGHFPEKDVPEATTIRFLEFWSRRNFGAMSKLYCSLNDPGSSQHAGRVRESLDDCKVEAYQIESVTDEAPAISVVNATLALRSGVQMACTIRLIYETPSGNVCTRGTAGGAWRIVWARVAE
jgi:hypothetical protein